MRKIAVRQFAILAHRLDQPWFERSHLVAQSLQRGLQNIGLTTNVSVCVYDNPEAYLEHRSITADPYEDCFICHATRLPRLAQRQPLQAFWILVSGGMIRIADGAVHPFSHQPLLLFPDATGKEANFENWLASWCELGGDAAAFSASEPTLQDGLDPGLRSCRRLLEWFIPVAMILRSHATIASPRENVDDVSEQVSSSTRESIDAWLIDTVQSMLDDKECMRTLYEHRDTVLKLLTGPFPPSCLSRRDISLVHSLLARPVPNPDDCATASVNRDLESRLVGLVEKNTDPDALLCKVTDLLASIEASQEALSWVLNAKGFERERSSIAHDLIKNCMRPLLESLTKGDCENLRNAFGRLRGCSEMLLQRLARFEIALACSPYFRHCYDAPQRYERAKNDAQQMVHELASRSDADEMSLDALAKCAESLGLITRFLEDIRDGGLSMSPVDVVI